MVQPTRPWPTPPSPKQPPPWPNSGLLANNMSDYKIQVAMYEIRKQAGNIAEWIFWRYGRGPSITVQWPVGPVEVPNGDNAGVLTESADPNDHYRPYLEKNVGKQNRDWVWGLRDNNAAENRLTIKFRKSKAKWATMAAILWA